MQAKESLGIRPVERHKWPWIAAVLLLAVAGVHFLGGAYWLWLHSQSRATESFRAGGALLLVLLAVIQLRIAWSAWRNRTNVDQPVLFLNRLFWRWLACGFVVCYAAGVLFPERDDARYFFWPALGAWYTLVQIACVVRPRPLERLSALLGRRWMRVVGWTAYVLIMLPLAAEAGLRLYALAANDPMTVAYVTNQLKMSPGSELRGQRINDCGYWDGPFALERPRGRFRVAAVGDEITLCGTAQTNFLARFERLVPKIEVYNFGIPAAGPQQYAEQIAGEVATHRPDLVLIFFSVGTDVTDVVPLPGAFQWEGLRLVQFGSRFGGSESRWRNLGRVEVGQLAQRPDDLGRSASGLSVCYTPIDDVLRQRWKEVFSQLDDALDECRESNLSLALVVVPGQFQVDPGLCKVLCRRVGFECSKLDVSLPQRRLMQYAKSRNLPMIDLLPILQSSREPTFERNHRLLNDRGNALAAEAISAWFMKRYPGRPTEAKLAGR